MSSCLGIFLGENIVKYARINVDNNKQVKIEQCGTRIIKESKKELILKLIEETKSAEIPLVLNVQNDNYQSFEVYDQVNNITSEYVKEIIKTEFEAWCEKERLNIGELSYVYDICDVKTENGKRKVVVNYARNSDIEQYKTINDKQVSAIYPTELIVKNIVPKTESSYILVDVDEHLNVTTVIDGKFTDFKSFDIGMLQVLEEFSIKLGSISKAYESCKKINTYTEGESQNDPQLESILEPILQDILRNVLAIVNRNRKNVDKVYLTGMATVFTNIDILFQDYLDMKCEILKPAFITQNTDVRNISETIEAIPAISLAYSYLVETSNSQLSYISLLNKKQSSFKSIFSPDRKIGDILRDLKLKFLNNKVKQENLAPKETKDKNTKGTGKNKKTIVVDFATESLVQTITTFCIIVGMILFTYLGFDQIYIGSINKNISDMNEKIDRLKSQEQQVESDISYTNTNMKKYKDINDEVSLVVSKIESNEIGKFSTYNVAHFLQQIIKFIPDNVRLITIESDDNKNIEMVMESESYSGLGFFVAQIKLQGILNSTKIKDIKNGETITVTIGGELP